MFERLKKDSLTKLKWITFESSRGERFEDAFSTVVGQRAFDGDFVNCLANRKTNLEKTFWKLAILNMAILGVLFLNSSVVKVEFIISGISAKDISKIKEILLLMSATITIFASIASSEINALDSVLKAWVRKKFPEDIRGFVLLRFGNLLGTIPSMIRPKNRNFSETKAVLAWQVIFIFSLMLFAFSYSIINLSVYIIVILDVIKSPSLPWMWSWLVVAYVIVANIASYGLIGFRWLPLPYRDYSLVMDLTELKKKNPVEYQMKIREIVSGKGD